MSKTWPGVQGELALAGLRDADPTGLLAQIDRIIVWDLPLRTRFRGYPRRYGLLLHGPLGWGEVAPFWDYDAPASAPWLAAGLEQATSDLTSLPVHRAQIPVNVTIPEVDGDTARDLVAAAGATTAKVKVAGSDDSLAADLERLAAVRAALGPQGRVRIDVNGAWDLATAKTLLPRLDREAGGLEYVEQPCRDVTELAALRRALDIPIAADEAIRLSADPVAVCRLGAADIAVLKVGPLGGIRRALALAERLGLPAVVSSALDTSVGLGAGAVLAAALPDLGYACGLGTSSLLAADVALPSVVPRGGLLPLRPVEVSEPLLAAAGASEELVSRWRTRLVGILAALADRRERELRGWSVPVAGVPL